MLVAAPYIDFNGPPRVISEVRKTCSGFVDFRPKLTGDLLVKNGGDGKWWPRKAAVRNGQLHISGSQHAAALRLPLRHLSLRAGPLPNSLSLCRGANVVLTLQTANEHAFDTWVKTIAIELIRQTPLDAVKYLDIFTLANCWKQKPDKDCNSNYITSPPIECLSPLIPEEDEDEEAHEEKTVETLLKKCQNAENYVPVKEKLMLFESLCKLGRKVRSSEDVSCRGVAATKRARSLHDLTNFQAQSAVREICRYFEVKNEAVNTSVDKYGTITRFNRSDSQLSQKRT